MSDDGEREIPARVAVVEAAVRVVIEDLGTGWRGKFRYDDVRQQMDREVSDRTIRRGLKDAAAMGWVKDRRQGWGPGPLAEQYERVEQGE